MSRPTDLSFGFYGVAIIEPVLAYSLKSPKNVKASQKLLYRLK